MIFTALHQIQIQILWQVVIKCKYIHVCFGILIVKDGLGITFFITKNKRNYFSLHVMQNLKNLNTLTQILMTCILFTLTNFINYLNRFISNPKNAEVHFYPRIQSYEDMMEFDDL